VQNQHNIFTSWLPDAMKDRHPYQHYFILLRWLSRCFLILRSL